MFTRFIVAFIIFSGLLNYSCSNDNKFGFTRSSIVTGDTLLGRVISFPQSLKILENGLLSNNENLNNGKKKIVSIIDGVCMKCIINNLNTLDSLLFFELADSNIQVLYVLNVSKTDSLFFRLNLEPFIKVTGKLLWDNNYNFERQNRLFSSNTNLRTFMTNDRNEIIQYGSPLIYPELISDYRNKAIDR